MMLSIRSRPMLYLTLPGVAFIMGVLWLRRRNKIRCGDMGKDGKKEEEVNAVNSKGAAVLQPDQQKSNSLAINGSIGNNNYKNNLNNHSNDSNSSIPTQILGKSAPIKIVQNGKNSSTVYLTDKQIDSEILKNKIQDAEDKMLRSIDEQSPGSVDLPGSINESSISSKRISANAQNPIVIKATSSPKISPENSFMESKYSPDRKAVDEQNNNQEEVRKSEEKRKSEVTSPSLSLCSEQSSTDSGKGSSLPRSEQQVTSTSVGKVEAASSNVQKTTSSTYEFYLPTSLVGRMYGSKHSYLHFIKYRSSAKIILKKHPVSEKIRVCAIEGTDQEINAALKLIRMKLPAKKYPNLTMQRIHFATPQTIVPLTKEHSMGLKLNLIEEINNDVLVSAVITGAHIFVQQPLHPSHPSLSLLQRGLCENYNKAETPMLPEIAENGICVCNVDKVWYRVQIVQKDAEDEHSCLVKFLDYGGYMTVGLNDLRQIRSDYMAMPFQATECVLSNIEPTTDACWSPKATEVLYQLTKGIVLQAQVAGYTSDNIPEIYLYASISPNNVVFINKELVARNLAKWVETED